jgi:hypothetical protein
MKNRILHLIYWVIYAITISPLALFGGITYFITYPFWYIHEQIADGILLKHITNKDKKLRNWLLDIRDKL